MDKENKPGILEEEYVENIFQRLQGSIVHWGRQRYWQWRILLLVWFVYVGIRHLLCPGYWSLFGPINLGIHELGHVVLSWAPKFLYVAGGTIFQLTAPVVSFFIFMRQPDYFGLTVCKVWFSTNLYYVAWYLGDARAKSIPLVSVGGGDVQHDWSYLLARMGLLPYDTKIAVGIRIVAFAFMWAGIVGGLWILWIMATGMKKGKDCV